MGYFLFFLKGKEMLGKGKGGTGWVKGRVDGMGEGNVERGEGVLMLEAPESKQEWRIQNWICTGH